MSVMLFLRVRENQNVIKIDNTKYVKDVTESILNERLKCIWCVSKTIVDNEMFKETIRCLKSCLPIISFLNANM